MKSYLYKKRKTIFLDILCSFLYTICIGAIPIVTKTLFDWTDNLTLNRLIFLFFIYFILVVISMVSQYFSQYFGWKYGSKIQEEQRNDLMKTIMASTFEEFNEFKKDEYLSIFSNDIKAIMDQYVVRSVDIIKSSLSLIVYAAYMFNFLGISISSVIIIVSLLTLNLPKFTGNSLAEKRSKHLASMGKFITVASDVLSGFNLTNTRTKKNVLKYFEDSSRAVQENEFKYGKYKAFTIVFNGFVMYLLNISTFIVAGVLLYLKKVTLGTVTASLSYMEEFIWPIRYLIDDINEIQAIKKVLAKITRITNRGHKESKNKNISSFSELSFKDVSATLGSFTIDNLCLNVDFGEKIALIGHSGSGKSTIFKLLTKQVPIDNGCILIDSNNIYDYDTSHILDGVYPGNHVYAVSFLSNITMFGSYSYDKLNDYLSKYPNPKIEELKLVEDCSVLSNGEKQIISLLRVFLSDTDVVLLDEAFSSIDKINREYFLDMFLNGAKTIIAITHDTSKEMLSRFNKNIIMENGKILK